MTHYNVALKHIMQFWCIRKAAVRGGGGITSAGMKLSQVQNLYDKKLPWQNWRNGYCQSIFSSLFLFPSFLSVSSRSWLPSQPDALQPGCIRPRTASVPSAASCPSAARCYSPTRGLPSPASIQPGFCCTTTQNWIKDHRNRTLSHCKSAATFLDLAELEINHERLSSCIWWLNMGKLRYIYSCCGIFVLLKSCQVKLLTPLGPYCMDLQCSSGENVVIIIIIFLLNI